jgi:2-polyprenyl-6-methoxyphenol hydroxylase-like FAD-dependent oxidoreductase
MARIVVIGAGLAGLATAVALQRRDHDVSIVERRTHTSTGAAISIWPNALAALDQLGLGDAVRMAGGRVAVGALRWRDGSWLRHPASGIMISSLGEPLVVIQRSALRDILVAAVRAGAIEYGQVADGLLATADGMQIKLSDNTVRHADAVVGADGTGSMVACHRNGPLTQRYAAYTAWRGIASYAMDPELAGATLGPGVETGHVPIGQDREGELPYLRAKLAGWPEPVPGILAATAPADVLRATTFTTAPVRGTRTCGAGRRRRPSDAPAFGPGRLSGVGRRRDSGGLRRADRQPVDSFRQVRRLPAATDHVAGA